MMKAAVVGLGWWGRHFVNTIEKTDKIEVTRIAARNRDKHQEFADEKGLKLLSSYEEVLADSEVDAVMLCTPHSQHEEQVMQAIDAGKQIFCEKPLSLTKASVERMIAATQKAGLIMGVGHERRYEATMEEITRIVKEPEFGTHMHVEANFSHDILASLDADNWRGTKEEAPAAAFTGMGIHLTDLFLSMLGPVDAVCAQTAKRVLPLPTGDIVGIQLRFASGATGFLCAVSATPYYGRFTVFGEKMWVEARDEAHPQHGGKTHLITCGKDGKQHERVLDAKDPVLANIVEWVDAVEGRGDYRFTDEQRIGNVAILEAVAKSVESGNWEAT